ncbi:MAG: hypothetical protein A2339_07245 [Elusimicrobia bacterium RIFOXYB12_FULL_50_12]|nr:MAG: hypothetical protein A2251_03735 [Elusimicrobia bacterium RIFOXYA2_FULL_47_53]OGS26823.1 MAG: hypothetical protein A2339_07245 [Elusimicrobia bacterium RIFOXYB12_FULL_50_12]OGS30720.1 MAG: hypothetical protein A2323_07540 [Elusimicrobia bacterium RIFOXYB2_FULL_46_23]
MRNRSNENQSAIRRIKAAIAKTIKLYNNTEARQKHWFTQNFTGKERKIRRRTCEIPPRRDYLRSEKRKGKRKFLVITSPSQDLVYCRTM